MNDLFDQFHLAPRWLIKLALVGTGAVALFALVSAIPVLIYLLTAPFRPFGLVLLGMAAVPWLYLDILLRSLGAPTVQHSRLWLVFALVAGLATLAAYVMFLMAAPRPFYLYLPPAAGALAIYTLIASMIGYARQGAYRR